jgi:hypothetical protein
MTTAEIVPVLLRGFFDTVLRDAEYSLVQEVVSVMLERIFNLYSVDGYVATTPTGVLFACARVYAVFTPCAR